MLWHSFHLENLFLSFQNKDPHLFSSQSATGRVTHSDFAFEVYLFFFQRGLTQYTFSTKLLGIRHGGMLGIRQKVNYRPDLKNSWYPLGSYTA